MENKNPFQEREQELDRAAGKELRDIDVRTERWLNKLGCYFNEERTNTWYLHRGSETVGQCLVCGQPIYKNHPGQIVKYHKECRHLRHKVV